MPNTLLPLPLQLEQYRQQHGDPHVGYREEDDVALGNWVAKQRSAARGGQLEQAKRDRLEVGCCPAAALLGQVLSSVFVGGEGASLGLVLGKQHLPASELPAHRAAQVLYAATLQTLGFEFDADVQNTKQTRKINLKSSG